MKVLLRFIVIVSFVGHIYCQSVNDLVDDAKKTLKLDNIDLDDVKKKLEDDLPDISELGNVNGTHLPKAEDVENVLKEKCEKNGAPGAVDSLKNEQENVKFCVEKYVNFTVVQEELEKAKETGSMDEVFGKYCKKWPSIYKCFDNVTSTARLCMEDGEIKAFNKSLEILSELQEFMCFKDGDRLAMFVAEGGVECVQERKQGIQDCLNSTLGARIPDSDDFSVATLPTFLFSNKDCQDFDAVRICVNEQLEKCKDSTPANIVDAFFKFLKRHMPCNGFDGEPRTGKLDKTIHESDSGSWSVTGTMLLVVVSLISLRI